MILKNYPRAGVWSSLHQSRRQTYRNDVIRIMAVNLKTEGGAFKVYGTFRNNKTLMTMNLTVNLGPGRNCCASLINLYPQSKFQEDRTTIKLFCVAWLPSPTLPTPEPEMAYQI